MKTQVSTLKNYACDLTRSQELAYPHHLDGEPLGVGAAVGVGPSSGESLFQFIIQCMKTQVSTLKN